MTKVLILQEYVPRYRAEFFSKLIQLGADAGIGIEIAAGSPRKLQSARGDAVCPAWLHEIPQREVRILGRRVVWRRSLTLIRDADLIVFEQARRNLDSYIAAIPGVFSKQKFAMWGHGSDYVESPTPLMSLIAEWLTMRCDWFFAYTAGGKQRVVKRGFPSDRITVVQNSIDSTGLRSDIMGVSAGAISAFNRQLDLRGKTAAYVGALDESKRIPFLFSASLRTHAQDSDYRLLLAGDGPLRESVERFASQHSWVSYLGPLYGLEKAKMLAAAQVLAMPGRVGLVSVDSFAAGTPIVTTDWPWHAPEFEYLMNGVNAVVSQNDVAAYSTALLDLLCDGAKLRKMATECSQSADVYSIEKMARNFLAGIKTALAGELR